MSSAVAKRREQRHQQLQLFSRPKQPGQMASPINLWVHQQTLDNRLRVALPLWDQSPAQFQPRDAMRFPDHAPSGRALQQGASASQHVLQEYLLRNRIHEGEMMQPQPLQAGRRSNARLHRYAPQDAVAVKQELTEQAEDHPTVQQEQQVKDGELDETSSRVLTLLLLGAGLGILLFALGPSNG